MSQADVEHRDPREILDELAFLETWQADYRYCWEEKSDKSLSPFERQAQYPRAKEMLSQWSDVRAIMRTLQNNLATSYKLIDFSKLQYLAVAPFQC